MLWGSETAWYRQNQLNFQEGFKLSQIYQMMWCGKGCYTFWPSENNVTITFTPYHNSGAGKDMNIFILSELFAVHSLGND